MVVLQQVQQRFERLGEPVTILPHGFAPLVPETLPAHRRNGVHQAVQHRQRVIALEDHHRLVALQPARDPRRHAGLAQIAHAVQQHATGSAGPRVDLGKRTEHPLQHTPPTDKRAPPSHRHPLALLVEELPVRALASVLALLSLTRNQRPTSARTNIEPRQMPVRAAVRIGACGLQQLASRPGRRQRHGPPLRQFVIEVLGEGRGIHVPHRAIPAQHMRHPGTDQLPHHRLGRAAAPFLARLDPLGRPARRQEEQRQTVGLTNRPDERRHIRQRHAATLVLQRQHRATPLVDIAMAGQVQHVERAIRRQPVLQPLRRAGLLDEQVQRLAVGGLQDRGLLRLEGQHMLALRRRRHEQHLQIRKLGHPRSRRRTDAPHHLEGLHSVLGQPALRPGQQLPRRVEQRAGRFVLQRLGSYADVQHPRARPRRPRRSPARRLVQPVPQFAADEAQRVRAAVGPHRHVIALRPVAQQRQGALLIEPLLRRLHVLGAAEHVAATQFDGCFHVASLR